MNLFVLVRRARISVRFLNLFAVVLVLSACAAEPTKEEYRERFLTQITDDGSKWFIYTAHPVRNLNNQIRRNVAEISADGAIHAQRRSQQADKPKSDRRSSKAAPIEKGRFNKMLTHYIQSKGFCRNGFIMLDSEETANNFYFWGECKETATAGDEQKWKNSPYFNKEKRS